MTMTSYLRPIPGTPVGSIAISDGAVTIESWTIENPSLCEYLQTFSSPIEQLKAINDMIMLAINVHKLSASSLETENVKKSAEIVVENLNGTVATVIANLEAAAHRLVDPDTGVVALQMRETSKSINEKGDVALKGLLAPHDPASPLGQLLTSVNVALNSHVTGIKSDIEAVTSVLNQFIGAQDKKKQMMSNSPQKGGVLEEVVDGIVQHEALVLADDALYTGDTFSPSGDRDGDGVVTLNLAATKGVPVKFVIEYKTNKSFKDVKGRLKREKVIKELNDGIKNRDAVCGIFVSDVQGLNLQVQPIWQEFDGNKLAIVIDPDDPNEHLIRVAYLWARSYAMKFVAAKDFDGKQVTDLLENLVSEIASLQTLKNVHTPIRNNIQKAEAFVKQFEDKLSNLVYELRTLVADE